jgi:hypothetical protein
MASVERINSPTYRLELTEDEFRILIEGAYQVYAKISSGATSHFSEELWHPAKVDVETAHQISHDFYNKMICEVNS